VPLLVVLLLLMAATIMMVLTAMIRILLIMTGREPASQGRL
jgi:hypothetical protein